MVIKSADGAPAIFQISHSMTAHPADTLQPNSLDAPYCPYYSLEEIDFDDEFKVC